MYSAFLHFMNNYGLHQYVNRPTRGDKILDIVLSSSDSLVNDIQVTPPFSINDHNILLFLTSMKMMQMRTRVLVIWMLKIKMALKTF